MGKIPRFEEYAAEIDAHGTDKQRADLALIRQLRAGEVAKNNAPVDGIIEKTRTRFAGQDLGGPTIAQITSFRSQSDTKGIVPQRPRLDEIEKRMK